MVHNFVFIALVVWVIAWFGVACEMMDSSKKEFWFDFLKHSFLLIFFIIFSAFFWRLLEEKVLLNLYMEFVIFLYEAVYVGLLS